MLCKSEETGTAFHMVVAVKRDITLTAWVRIDSPVVKFISAWVKDVALGQANV